MTISPYSIPGIVDTTPLDARSIIYLVTDYYQIKERSIYGKSRQIGFCIPRQVAIYIIKKKTNLTSVAIGRLFNRDHSTILHSINVINNYFFTKNESIINAITEIEGRLKMKN